MNPNDQAASSITADVNFEATGKQHGHFSVPNSSDCSAWGSVQIPITIIANGTGPTVTMIGGCHGDEYEGPITLMRLAEELNANDISGRLILIPCLNIPAIESQTRLSPLDNINLNRAFPGNQVGTISYKIADYLTRNVLEISDIVLDLHSGGNSLSVAPLAAVHFLDDRNLQQQAEEIMIAFGAPNSLRIKEQDDRGMMDSTVEKMGKIFVTTEIGGGGTATAETLDITYTGCRNVLSKTGLISPEITLRATRMLELPDPECFVIAKDYGLLEMRTGLGWDCHRGNLLARIHPINRSGMKPVEYITHRNGILMARHHQGLIRPGDCLAVIADEVQR